MKKINFVIIILYALFFYSCNESKDLQHLNGYWEINSVSIEGKEVKNYPFSGTIDYFILDENNGYMLMHETLFSFIPTTYTNLWETNDGGVNWEIIPVPSYLSALYVNDMDHIITGGSLDSTSFIINEFTVYKIFQGSFHGPHF